MHLHHGPHRTLAEINRLIDGSALSAAGKERAKALFHRLGEAEAAVHGIPLERVHLHEVGALDSIIDIVGAVYAMEAIGADRVVSSPLNVGGGTVRSAHGLYPVPAPATAMLLKGAPVYSGQQQVETGHADWRAAHHRLCRVVWRHSGDAAREDRLRCRVRDLPDTPNVLRVLVGEAASDAPSHVVVGHRSRDRRHESPDSLGC